MALDVGRQLAVQREQLHARRIAGRDCDFASVECVVHCDFEGVDRRCDHRQRRRGRRILRVSRHQGDDVSSKRDKIGIDLSREAEGDA